MDFTKGAAEELSAMSEEEYNLKKIALDSLTSCLENHVNNCVDGQFDSDDVALINSYMDNIMSIVLHRPHTTKSDEII